LFLLQIFAILYYRKLILKQIYYNRHLPL